MKNTKASTVPPRHMLRTEAEEQCDLMVWANSCVVSGVHPELQLLHAIPNGGRRDRAEAAHLKRQGVKPGVPDLSLPVPRGVYHGLYIEMKVGKNKPTQNQRQWLTILSYYGYATRVCYSANEARDVIEKYLSLGEAKL